MKKQINYLRSKIKKLSLKILKGTFFLKEEEEEEEEEEVENSALSSDKKLFLKNSSKINIKYSTLEKVKKIIKIATTTAVKSWPEQN